MVPECFFYRCIIRKTDGHCSALHRCGTHTGRDYEHTVFKKKEGLSPIDYLTQVRMEAAKSTLRNTDIPASEIAALVGYEDPRYFYKVFKKYTGLTPTEYRS